MNPSGRESGERFHPLGEACREGRTPRRRADPSNLRPGRTDVDGRTVLVGNGYALRRPSAVLMTFGAAPRLRAASCSSANPHLALPKTTRCVRHMRDVGAFNIPSRRARSLESSNIVGITNDVCRRAFNAFAEDGWPMGCLHRHDASGRPTHCVAGDNAVRGAEVAWINAV